MSCCYRIFVLIALMLLSACATCAILFPTFRKPTKTIAGVTTKETIYYWYMESSMVSNMSTDITRTYTRDNSCNSERVYLTVSAALSVAGAGLGGLACMFVACWVCAGHRAALGAVSVVLNLLAFACCVVVVAMSAFLFVDAQCGSALKKSYKDSNYKLVEGFILMAVAAGGFLVMLLVQMIALCCCFCCEHSNYDDTQDFSRHSSKSSGDSRSEYTRRSSRRGSYRD